jgi:hypothetical protein
MSYILITVLQFNRVRGKVPRRSWPVGERRWREMPSQGSAFHWRNSRPNGAALRQDPVGAIGGAL